MVNKIFFLATNDGKTLEYKHKRKADSRYWEGAVRTMGRRKK